MNTQALQSVMQKWADLSGSKLQINASNKRGHESAFSFVWTKPLWVLGEEGWELEEDQGAPIQVCVMEDGEVFIGADVADEEEGYSMVLLTEEADEVDQALELLWNATAELFEDPIPLELQGSHLAELRAWFEISFTPDDEEECCDEEDCDCDGAHHEDCECDEDCCEDCDCEGECDCECEDAFIEGRMVTIACDAKPAVKLHCPVCGKPAEGQYCPHVLFVNENSEKLLFIAPTFKAELEERGVSIEDFTSDPEQLRDDDSWDSDYLFLDVLRLAEDEETGVDLYAGFHFKW